MKEANTLISITLIRFAAAKIYAITFCVWSETSRDAIFYGDVFFVFSFV